MKSQIRALLLLLSLTATAASAALPVTTSPLGELLIATEQNAPATVVARNAPTLASEISARIQALPARVGDVVSRGDVLAQLDCRAYESAQRAAESGLARLQAQLKFARRQHERALDLQRKKGISDEIVEQRESEVASLESQRQSQEEAITQAALDVERCTLVAPFDAAVTARLADVGGLAAPGTPLLSLVETAAPEVSAELDAVEAAAISDSSELRLEYDGGRYALESPRLVAVIDERTRTRTARFAFRDNTAPPGAAGRLVWRSSAARVPAEYLVRRDGRLGIVRTFPQRA